MKIIIKEIDRIDNDIMVKFETAVGPGKAFWSKRTDVPDMGSVCDVEFDIEDSIDFGRTAEKSKNHIYCLSIDNHNLILNGLVDSIDDDGMVYFRLSPYCLIMIESKLGHIKPGDWLLLKINTSDVEMTAL